MIPYSDSFFKDLEIQFKETNKIVIDKIDSINTIVDQIEDTIKELHQWLKNFTFDSKEEEIIFFKEYKPRLVAYLIYYNKIIEFETNAPCSTKEKLKYFNRELNEISSYNNKIKIFYQYYRSKATHNDAKYFTRNRDKKLNYYESHIINYDTRLSTSHDYNVAVIKANDLLTDYLENKMNLLKNRKNNQFIKVDTTIEWTGNRIDLIELIYALHTQKVLNYGQTDLKDLSKFFGQIFNQDIEESIYRSFIDIKNRKNSKTKFLNSLSENLNNRIDEEDK